MINILHLTLSLNAGGRERVIVNLNNSLLDSGIISSICCLKQSGILAQELNSKIKIFELNKRDRIDLSIVKTLKNYIINNNINILHCHNPGTLFYGLLSSKWAKTPAIISTEHGFNEKISWKSRKKEKLIYRYVDRIIAVSEKLKNDLKDIFSINGERISVIHNGTPSLFINEDKRLSKKKIGFSNLKFNVGVISRLVPIKNHQMAFKALQIVLEKIQDIHFWIIGSGELEEDLKKLTYTLKIEKNVSFLGTRNDIPYILNALDCFVLSSISEGLSMTILEAMSVGIPIIATNVGGNQELITNGISGILVKSNSETELARAILMLIEDKKLREKLGSMAKKQFEKKFSIEKMVSEHIQIYRTVLNNKD